MEVELRCFMTDEFQTVDWPVSITVSVNSVQLQPCHRRPLGIKSVCRPGMNVIQISASGCCCVSIVIMVCMQFCLRHQDALSKILSKTAVAITN